MTTNRLYIFPGNIFEGENRLVKHNLAGREVFSFRKNYNRRGEKNQASAREEHVRDGYRDEQTDNRALKEEDKQFGQVDGDFGAEDKPADLR